MLTTGLLAEPRAQYPRHQELRDVTIGEDGRQNRYSGRVATFFAKLPTVAQNSEYLLKVHYLGMRNLEALIQRLCIFRA